MSETITKTGIIGGGLSVNSNTAAKEVAIHEFNNPHSVAYMVPPAVRKSLEEIDPRWFGCSEGELRKNVEPDQVDEMLRLSFWDEYTAAVDANRRIKMENVYGRICSKEFFYKYVLPNQLRLAYVLRPPMEYTFKMRDLLEMGHRRMREILALPIQDGRGKPDTKLIAEIVKIVALVENRVRGAVVQKVQMEQKSVNINVEAPKNYFEINDELRNLEKEIRQLEGGSDGGEREPEEGTTKDVEAKEVTASPGPGVDEGESAAFVRGEDVQVAEEVLRVEEQG